VPLGAAPTWMDAAVPNTTDYLLRSLRFVLNASKIDVRSVSVGPCPGSWQVRPSVCSNITSGNTDPAKGGLRGEVAAAFCADEPHAASER
jgi:hypothetical protein